MVRSLLISIPMLVCFFWSIFFVIRCFRGNDEPRVKGAILLFYIVATVLYFDHWMYFSGVVSLGCDWSYAFVNLCVYPLYYAYLRALTRTEKSWEVPLLLVPAMLALVLFPVGRFSGRIADATMFLAIRLCFTVQVVWVLVRGYRLLLVTIRRMDNTYSDDRSRLLRPTHMWLLLFGITAVMSIVLNFMGRDFFAHELSVMLPAIVMSVLLFGLGYIAAHTTVPPESAAEETVPAKDMPNTDAQEPLDSLRARIEQVMTEQHLYSKPNLTIHDLAAAVNSNRTYVSAAINRENGMNFATYINRFRVEEAKRILRDSKYAQDKEAIIDAISLSGFMSDQTFYRVFKEQTGMTPLQFRHSH